MINEKMLLHAVSWAMQNIYNTNKEAQDILKNEELTEQDKIKLLSGTSGVDYRLLNLILLMKPLKEFALQHFPDQEPFFPWLDERLSFIKENKLVDGECMCRGCKEPELQAQ
jgi:hypothetical protein